MESRLLETICAILTTGMEGICFVFFCNSFLSAAPKEKTPNLKRREGGVFPLGGGIESRSSLGFSPPIFQSNILYYISAPALFILASMIIKQLFPEILSPNLLSVLIGIIISLFCCNGRLLNNFFRLMAFYLLVVGLNIISLFFVALLIQESCLAVIEDHTSFIYEMFLSKTLLFTILDFLRIVKRKYRNSSALKDWLLFALVPPVVCFGVTMLLSNQLIAGNKLSLWVIFNLSSFFGLEIIAILIEKQMYKQNQSLTEKKLWKQQLKNTQVHIRSLKEAQQKIRHLAHEIDHQLACVGGLIEQGNYDQAKEYIHTITQTADAIILPVNTNNVFVDALLNHEFFLAKSRGIDFRFELTDLSEIAVEPFDFVMILSNALENAIEASQQAETKKVIDLKIRNMTDKVIISVKNPVVERVEVVNNTIPTKKEGYLHGLGIENIKYCLEKYGGELSLICEEREFQLIALIPKILLVQDKNSYQ